MEIITPINAETFLTYIIKAGPQIRETLENDSPVKTSLEVAEIFAQALLKAKALGNKVKSAGAKVVAAIAVASCDVWQIITEIFKNESHKEFKIKYEKLAKFLEELEVETKVKIDAIGELTNGIKQRVLNLHKVEFDKLHAFIDSVSFQVRMIELEIQCCKKKIAFVLEKIQNFAKSITDVHDNDRMWTIIKGVAGVVGGVALMPICPIAPVAAVSAALQLGNVLTYNQRSNERTEFKGNLKLEEMKFENMKVNLENHETNLFGLKEMAEEFRKHATPAN